MWMADDDELFRQHLPLARQMAERFRTKDRLAIETAAMVGLWEAARAFDERRGVPFTAFARVRIKGAMVDEVRELTNYKRRVVY